jgi:hypothetical protein
MGIGNACFVIVGKNHRYIKAGGFNINGIAGTAIL